MKIAMLGLTDTDLPTSSIFNVSKDLIDEGRVRGRTETDFYYRYELILLGLLELFEFVVKQQRAYVLPND